MRAQVDGAADVELVPHAVVAPQVLAVAPVTGALATRGTTNRNARGSVRDRAARRAFLLATFGDGTTAPCYRCALELVDATITVDRIVPGRDGGTYRRGNIRPACGPCNSSTGGALARHGATR